MLNVDLSKQKRNSKIKVDLEDYLGRAIHVIGNEMPNARDYIVKEYAGDVLSEYAKNPAETMKAIQTKSSELKKEARAHTLRTKIQFKVGSEIQRNSKYGPGFKKEKEEYCGEGLVLGSGGTERLPGARELAYSAVAALLLLPTAQVAPHVAIPIAAAVGTGITLSLSRKMLDAATYSWTDKKEKEMNSYVQIKQKLWALKTLKKELTSQGKEASGAGRKEDVVNTAVMRTLAGGR